MAEWRVYGPPGTGKTTYVADQARAAVSVHGSNSVLICSLTKAAAAEIGGRVTGVASSCVGTLHSICYHALGRPTIVGAKEIVDWNARNPDLSISPEALGGKSVDSVEDSIPVNTSNGDKLLLDLDRLRAAMTDTSVSYAVNAFEQRWTAWKNEHGYADFTDLISQAIEKLPFAPGSPRVIFADEYQDCSRLEVKLLRAWSEAADSMIVVGDPDQSLYYWRGADPNLLTDDNVPLERTRSMKKSYRVPIAVHDRAMKMISSIPHRRQITYYPTDINGSIKRGGFTYKQPERCAEMVGEKIASGKTVMVIASCEYMIQPLIKIMRTIGIPYHNPYCGKWSPLRKTRDQISTWERLVAFMAPFTKEDASFTPAWSPRQLKLWSSMLAIGGVFNKNGRAIISKLNDASNVDEISRAILNAFESEALDALFTGDCKWVVEHSLVKFQRAADYPKRVLDRMGVEKFIDSERYEPRLRPWVTVGTVHSVKGGEADCVVVFPDLSPAFHKLTNIAGWMGIDSIKRLFYVAITRTRDELIVADPASSLHYKL